MRLRPAIESLVSKLAFFTGFSLTEIRGLTLRRIVTLFQLKG